MSDNIQKIIERLRDAVNGSHLSFAQLEDKTGIAKSSIHRYVTGQTQKIPIDNLQKLAKACGVSIESIMGWDKNPQPDIFSIPGILPPPTMVKKPRLGKISCGEPLLTEENFDGYDNVPSDIKCDFTLICQGDSMIGARIHDGDLVYIRQQPTVETGQIAAVLIDGTDEKLLKRVFIHTDSIVLQAENPAYSPLVFVGADMNNVRIIGKAVGFTSIIK